MSLNNQLSPENSGQSIGCDPKSSKRNSGLFAFFKWFKPSTSRESIHEFSQSSSCESLSSTHSAGTVASFSFVPPSAYKKCVSEKCIVLGPETDTYKARLKQRDKRRENEKHLTLRKKYNLFFNRDTLLKSKPVEEEENTKSLPLMTRTAMEIDEEAKLHRRTYSESSKLKKSGSYVHVKGKRKAPQPPGSKDGTMTLRRKKRLAPVPPAVNAEKVIKVLEKSNTAPDIICNDSLKLDHGILKSTKDADANPSVDQNSTNAANSPARSSYVEAPVSPRPWYKRNTSRDSGVNKKIEHKYEPIERLPEVPFTRNSSLDLTLDDIKLDKKKEEKRKSGLSFLTNISELDREATEIIKNKEHEKNGFGDITEMPDFMRPKDTKINTDSWVSPKRRSARDLIAKFNAITNVTKVTVFGASQKDVKLFGKQTSLDETKRRQETLLESHKKKIEEIDKKNSPLMKSESAAAIKAKSETPKSERKSWKCPKCNIENEYWRIICHVCSAIKPYFDDFSSNKVETKPEPKTSSPLLTKKEKSPPKKPELNLERSKTQIGFSALASYNATAKLKDKTQPESDNKKEEREKLKKMLIEMKNSLPKRKSNIIAKQNNRASVIVENPETTEENNLEEASSDKLEKTQGEKVAEILIGSTQTIYENIKIRRSDNPKPVKVSSSVQTSGVVKQMVPPTALTNLVADQTRNTYELMRPKDFEDIYADTNAKSAARIYANFARNDELSLFFNMPKQPHNVKANVQTKHNTDTIEINRLLKRLETSIAKGELTEAAIFAKELAQLKVNCSVVRQKPSPGDGKKKGIQIEMYVEDKVSHRGPFPIIVTPDQTVADLKKQIQKEFEIPTTYQKWILGKELVTDDNSTLQHHNITTEGCPVFLYLVAPDSKISSEIPKVPANDVKDLPSTSNAQKVKDTTVKGETERTVLNKKTEDKIEKVRTNVQNLQNLLNGNKGHSKNALVLSKVEDHTPKIVNVIPKTAEPKTKTESRIIPIEIEKAKTKDNKKPVSLTEIVIEKTSEIPIIRTSQEVKPNIQYVFPTIQNAAEFIPLSTKTPESTKFLGAVPKETTPSNVTPISKEPSKIAEDELEDYDSKTLKPAKEWECHLCTLLNPMTSNICAVCATVRLMKSKIHPVKKHLKKKAPQPKPGIVSTNKDQTYLQLVNLDNADLVENIEPFECVVCFMEIAAGEGVTLRECLHQFCKACLGHTIEFAEEAEVKCPYRDEDYSCNIALQDREIKALVTKVVYEQHLAKSVAQAENKIDKSFHCKTPDCKGWCIFEDNVNEFRCPVCRKTNCLTCQAIHFGMNCKQYQEKMNDESEIDDDARRTKDMLEEMVNKGEAIECPTCKVILMKKWGCDWLRCSMCKTEICWVTRGPRWGPSGKGDTSGGCQCGINGVKCHPKCNYCH